MSTALDQVGTALDQMGTCLSPSNHLPHMATVLHLLSFHSNPARWGLLSEPLQTLTLYLMRCYDHNSPKLAGYLLVISATFTCMVILPVLILRRVYSYQSDYLNYLT